MHSSPSSRDNRVPADRILSVDFWRGVALLTIFINHIPGNVFERLTHRNFGFSDATELFVMLAGVASALAYLPRFMAGEGASATVRIAQRTVQIYMAHIVLIVCCAAIIAQAVATSGDFRFFEAIHLDVLINDTVPGLIGLAGLGLQPAYMNVLPLYIVLLLMTPAFMMFASRSLALALGASAALYLAAQIFYLNLPTFPVEGWWFFNPLCWQFLFVIGIAIGALILTGRKPAYSPVLFWVSSAYLAVSAVWIVSGFWPGWNPQWLPRFIWDFDKTNLFLPRLVHVLALTYVAAYLPVERWLRGNSLMQPLIVLGRHSLPVFCLGTVLAIAAQVIRPLANGGLALDIIIISGGILAQFILSGVLEWYRKGQAASAALRRAPASQL